MLQAIEQGRNSDLRVDHIMNSLRIGVGLSWRRCCGRCGVAVDGRHVVTIRVWYGTKRHASSSLVRRREFWWLREEVVWLIIVGHAGARSDLSCELRLIVQVRAVQSVVLVGERVGGIPYEFGGGPSAASSIATIKRREHARARRGHSFHLHYSWLYNALPRQRTACLLPC